MPRLGFADSRRRAFTLVELLIVIAIAILLTASAIQLVRPSFQDRKVREATRQLNAIFANAKALAAERNRPVGVWLQRTPGNLNQCLDVYLAEVSPPYTGDLLNATVTVTGLDLSFAPMGAAATLTAVPGGLLQPGESFFIRFNYQGELYQATYINPMLPLRLDGVPASPPPAPVNGMPFQIYRNPRKSAGAPLELSNGIAIDLGYSGVAAGGSPGPWDSTNNEYPTIKFHGGTGMEFDAWNPPNSMGNDPADTNPVIIMFSPRGQLATVYWKNSAHVPRGPVHLLVGRNETIVTQDDAANPLPVDNPKIATPGDYGNLQDMSSLWFSVGQRTSSLTTSENFWNPGWSPLTLIWNSQGSPVLLPIDQCRQFARTTQTKGGG